MSGGQTGFGAPRPPSLTPVRSVSNPDERWSRSIVKKKVSPFLKTPFETLSFGQTGFEPATSTSRTSRATSCAIARKKQIKKVGTSRSCDLNVPNLIMEEPLRKIAKAWSNFLGSSFLL